MPKMPASTGNVDRDFANAMLAFERAMMSKAKMEVACGTDAKSESAAQSFFDDARERVKTMELFVHTNRSQKPTRVRARPQRRTSGSATAIPRQKIQTAGAELPLGR